MEILPIIMATDVVSREQWATRIGFILAAVGSAVGLGNIWRFPFQVGQEGGAAFLVVYLLFVVVIGLPAILVEFVIGRRAERNPITAFKRLGYGPWKVVGAIGVVTGFVILSFYTVVAGWVTRYFFASFTGSYFADPEAYFLGIASGLDTVAFHLLFVLLTAAIIAAGVQRGIELAVKVMVPAIIVLFLLLIAYAFTLEGATQGYAYYLSPEPGAIAENWRSILPAAAGQALFTLSLGMGVMITYASYLGEDRNLGGDSAWIVALDTGIAIMAGLIIFPVLFTIGAEPGEGGAGELFIGVGGAIADLPFNQVIGALFFGTVAIAALSSAISIMEVIVSYMIDGFEMERTSATGIVAAAIFLLGVPTALDLAVLEIYDTITAELLLPLGMFFLVLFTGWFYDEALDEISRGTARDTGGTLPTLWLWHVRTVLLVLIGVILLVSIQGLPGTLAEMASQIELV